jgi:hypothetical protein
MFDLADAGPGPAALTACTVNVYNPGTRVILNERAAAGWIGRAELASRLPAASTIRAVTTYPVMGNPPVAFGGLHMIVAVRFDDVALPITGAPGGAAGVTADDAAE